ncbi:MAG TPA: sensor domain-containing diguanylate cyclase [Actinomycetota bacterium]|nr:sensor domain-containing diguanylate cyclase [Actinomycetota bacterium]
MAERPRRPPQQAPADVDFKELVQNLPIAIFVVDREGRPCYANPAAVELLGKGADPDAAAEDLSERYKAYLSGTPHEYPRDRMPIVRALEGESCTVDDMEIRRPDGSVALQVWGTPVYDARTGIKYAIAAFTDITARKRAERALQEKEQQAKEEALRDDLTGLHNRRGLLHVMDALIKLGIRTERALALVYIDLDDMKKINDTFGHAQGDRALVDAARILEANLRESDFIARIGGDEFCIVLSGGNDVQDRAAIARIDAAVREHNATAGRPYDVSFSVGVARFDPSAPATVEELLHAADAAMYRDKAAKHGGS